MHFQLLPHIYLTMQDISDPTKSIQNLCVIKKAIYIVHTRVTMGFTFFAMCQRHMANALLHTAKSLPCVAYNKVPTVNNGHRLPVPVASGDIFLRGTRPAGFEPAATYLSCVTSTAASHSHLCLYSVFPPHIILNRV